MDSKTSQLVQITLSQLASRAIIDGSVKPSIVSYENNIVVKLGDKYLKIYSGISGKTRIRDNELALYSRLDNTQQLKDLVFSDRIGFGGEQFDYAVFREVKGTTLEQLDCDTSQAKKIASATHHFINSFLNIDCKGFGDIDENFSGSHNSFLDYTIDFQNKTNETLTTNPVTKNLVGMSDKIITMFGEKFDVKNPSIIPLDINQKNVMLTDNGEVKFIDPGVLVSGFSERAYGSFCANTYGTPVYDEFEKLIKDSDQSLVRASAILTSINVLAFIVRNNIAEPTQAKPFGNNRTFLDLISEHADFIGLKDKKQSLKIPNSIKPLQNSGGETMGGDE